MYLEIITPEQTLYKGDVESILFPGSHGDFQVLNNHAPIVSTLTKGKVKIIGKLMIEENAKDKFQFNERETVLDIESGTVEMNNKKSIVISTRRKEDFMDYLENYLEI